VLIERPELALIVKLEKSGWAHLARRAVLAVHTIGSGVRVALLHDLDPFLARSDVRGMRRAAGFLALQASIAFVRVEYQPELLVCMSHQSILLSSHVLTK
jgi:hypothetical protein